MLSYQYYAETVCLYRKQFEFPYNRYSAYPGHDIMRFVFYCTEYNNSQILSHRIANGIVKNRNKQRKQKVMHKVALIKYVSKDWYRVKLVRDAMLSIESPFWFNLVTLSRPTQSERVSKPFKISITYQYIPLTVSHRWWTVMCRHIWCVLKLVLSSQFYIIGWGR